MSSYLWVHFTLNLHLFLVPTVKLDNVVKYWNEDLAADKISANCRLVSFDGTRRTCASCCSSSLIGSEYYFNQSETRRAIRKRKNQKQKINKYFYFSFSDRLELTNSSLFIFFPPNLSLLILLYNIIELNIHSTPQTKSPNTLLENN